MLDRWKADRLFRQVLKRPDISKAYAMKGPSDSWYGTLCKVHRSLAEIQKLPHEAVRISSRDGLALQAVHYPCREPNARNATVIFIHGYTSHAEREWAFPGLFYHAAGYHVLIPYQRAHGPSQGRYISLGALERQDMLDWMEKAKALHPGTRIVIHGLSMGGGIALTLANVEEPCLRCIIADAPSLSGEACFEYHTQTRYPGNSRVLPLVKERFTREFGVGPEATNVRQYVSGSRHPILLAAGSMENMEADFEELRRLNPRETDTVILPGCNHGNGMYKQTELFQTAISEFLARYVP